MTDQMVVLIVRTKDVLLSERFSRFKDCAGYAASNDISFKERVEILKRMGEWAEKVSERIASLSREGTPVNRIEESLLSTISDGVLRLRFSNGILSKDEMDELLHSGHILPEGLVEVMNRILVQLDDEEYILFWNMGELEADGLLSH